MAEVARAAQALAEEASALGPSEPSAASQFDRARARGRQSAEATFWDIADIQFHCRVGRTTAWNLARTDRDFPPPVVLGSNRLVWPRSEVLAFMEARRSSGRYGRARRGISADKSGEAVFVTRSRQRRAPRNRG
jgi:predicted DNA-binding transcriptional regulator AlpA